MTDGGTAEFRQFEPGNTAEGAVDEAIQATREAVFPLHGLDPNG